MFGLYFDQVRNLPWVLLVEFIVEFVYLYPCLFQSFLPRFGQLVDAFAAAVRWLLVSSSGNQLLNVLFVDGGVIVYMHGPEFQEDKRFAMLPDAPLPKENRTLGAGSHRGGDHQESGQKK